jgi:DNA-binding Lrp family transcriptional regulator
MISRVNTQAVWSRFRSIKKQITTLIDVEPLPRVRDRITHLKFVPTSLKFESPRFGTIELPPEEGSRGGWTITFSKDLQTASSHILSWVLWREAFLSFLMPNIRQIPEAADLGLYAGLKYGGYNSDEKKMLSKLWSRVSPTQYHLYYNYDAPFGFPIFDQVANDFFLHRILLWLNSLRSSIYQPLSSSTYTAALERWMQETHNPLNKTEVRILNALCTNDQFSQSQLAMILNLSDSAISQALNRLAQRQLLRIFSFIDLPLVGLIPLEVKLQVSNRKQKRKIITLFSKISYIDFIIDTQRFLISRFIIPHDRVDEFKSWIYELTAKEGLASTDVNQDAHQSFIWNFRTYIPEKGWPTDFTVQLNQFQSSILGNEGSFLPQLKSHSYSYDLLTDHQTFPIKLRQEDFTYFGRSSELYRITDGVTSRPSQEVRKAGLLETAHMRYRRRVKKLEKQKISTTGGFWLQHINLNTTIHILIFESREITEQIMRALQLFPLMNGRIIENGNGYVLIYIPNKNAVDTLSTIRETIIEMELNAHININPAWQTLTDFEPPLNPSNYDFINSEWKWDSNTLP